MAKKTDKFNKFKIDREVLKGLNELQARDYAVVTKIYSDLVSGYKDFQNHINYLPLKSKTPDDHIKSSKFLKDCINLSCVLSESYKFFYEITNRYELLGFQNSQLSKNKIPFKDVRNIIGYHFNEDSVYVELFNGIFSHYYLNKGNNLVFYASDETTDAAFPATNLILWTMFYLIDHDIKWRAKYMKNKVEFVESKLKELSDNSKLLADWFDQYITKLINSHQEIIKSCSIVLADLYQPS